MVMKLFCFILMGIITIKEAMFFVALANLLHLAQDQIKNDINKYSHFFIYRINKDFNFKNFAQLVIFIFIFIFIFFLRRENFLKKNLILIIICFMNNTEVANAAIMICVNKTSCSRI